MPARRPASPPPFFSEIFLTLRTTAQPAKTAPTRNTVSNKSPMRKKAGKFYADWRDEHGVRHMKACRSKAAAQRLSTLKRREAAAKKDQRSATSRRSRARGSRAARATPAKSRKTSPQPRATSNPASSTPSTSRVS